MKKKTLSQAVEDFRGLIVHVRGVPVILDSDLARVYGVTTKALNQAVKRNKERFPAEFVFLVDHQGVTCLKASNLPETTPVGRGGRRKAIQAFTGCYRQPSNHENHVILSKKEQP